MSGGADSPGAASAPPASDSIRREARSLADAFKAETAKLVLALDSERLAELAATLWEAKEAGRRIFLFGNGGSHSLATHLACDLGKGGKRDGDRAAKPYRAQSLDNPAWLTAQANDGAGYFLAGGYPGSYAHGYDGVFVGQLENFLEPGDVVIAVSASGNSPNVVNALLFAKERGAKTVALVGFDGGAAARVADLAVTVPTEPGAYGLVEGVHGVVHHFLYECAKRLGREGEGGDGR